LDTRCRLFAGGAHIHVDFHADRHFGDFRCFPGHLVLLLLPDDFRPHLLKYCGSKSSPVKSFAWNLYLFMLRREEEFTELCEEPWSKRRGIKRFAVVRTAANGNSGCDGALPAPERNF
jgi:hypothetical protein